MYLASYLAMSETLATIGLEGVKFNAAIGWYPEERIFKNNFIVDLSVTFIVETSLTSDLNNSIDYMKIYTICASAFEKESLLIETVAQDIIDEIIKAFAVVSEINVTVKKLNPPVKAQIGASFIKLAYKIK